MDLLPIPYRSKPHDSAYSNRCSFEHKGVSAIPREPRKHGVTLTVELNSKNSYVLTLEERRNEEILRLFQISVSISWFCSCFKGLDNSFNIILLDFQGESTAGVRHEQS